MKRAKFNYGKLDYPSLANHNLLFSLRLKDRKTERQKDRKTERQKDRKTERKKDRKTDRQNTNLT